MLRLMPRRVLQASVLSRTSMITRHVSSEISGAAKEAEESLILFESKGNSRVYTLNRPKKRNALDDKMVNLIKAQIPKWDADPQCNVIVGTGVGPAFCAGGDIFSIMTWSKKEETRPNAVQFFKDEFEMNHLSGNLNTPYVAILDGITMGGGVGLSVHAPFRVATENTLFAMPETKIGYFPDVGSNYVLSRLDGELGPYLALTGTTLKGQAVYNVGIATHYVPSKVIPELRASLASLEEPNPDKVDKIIESFYPSSTELGPPTSLRLAIRTALDHAFSHRTVEGIVANLQEIANDSKHAAADWAKSTLQELDLRSPTSLKVALQAVRRGKLMTLAQVLQMEMDIATAFIHGASADFITGVTAVLVEKTRDRPEWSPSDLSGIPDTQIEKRFFDRSNSPYLVHSPRLEFIQQRERPFKNYALPSEEEIGEVVRGSHRTSGILSLNQEELVKHFDLMQISSKGGWFDKFSDVVWRRCKVVPGTKDTEEYIEWKHRGDK